MIIKAISLYEPYASLIATGAKRFETRSWATDYRGPLLICAAKWCIKKEINFLLAMPEFQGGLAPLIGKPLDLAGATHYGITIERLQFGKALAVVELVNCIPSLTMSKKKIGTDLPFGDFTPGRWAWELMLLKQFKPFNFRGRQGVFDAEIPDRLLS